MPLLETHGHRQLAQSKIFAKEILNNQTQQDSIKTEAVYRVFSQVVSNVSRQEIILQHTAHMLHAAEADKERDVSHNAEHMKHSFCSGDEYSIISKNPDSPKKHLMLF